MEKPTLQAVQQAIEASLRPLANAQQAVPMRAYMLDQFAFLGIRATPRRQALRGLPRLSAWGQDEWLALAEALWRLPEREFRYVAMLHQLGWKSQTDQQRLFRYALTLADEKDFFIRKAIGWALRDHARAQPDAVRDFLRQHAPQLSGLTRREAGKHLH